MSLIDEDLNVFNPDSVKITSYSNQKCDFTYKIIILGEASVGKSSIVQRIVANKFEEFYSATIGFDFVTLNAEFMDKRFKLQIWDTCGQEIYRSLISSFYKESSLAILVYAIDDIQSFEKLNFWLKELKNQTGPDLKLVALGNKTDLVLDRKVSIENLISFSAENSLSYYEEVSAKTGDNTNKIFAYVTKILYDQYCSTQISPYTNKATFKTVGSPNICLVKKMSLSDEVEKKEKDSCC